MIKENQKQRHKQKITNTTNKNIDRLTGTMRQDSSAYCTRNSIVKNDGKGTVVKKGKGKKNQGIILVFLKVNGKGIALQ